MEQGNLSKDPCPAPASHPFIPHFKEVPMAYTPEFTQQEAGIVRRIAWAMGIPMTVAYREIIQLAVKHISKKRVCLACKDQSFCDQCPFSRANSEGGVSTWTSAN
jgi:hypothetical protein